MESLPRHDMFFLVIWIWSFPASSAMCGGDKIRKAPYVTQLGEGTGGAARSGAQGTGTPAWSSKAAELQMFDPKSKGSWQFCLKSDMENQSL